MQPGRASGKTLEEIEEQLMTNEAKDDDMELGPSAPQVQLSRRKDDRNSSPLFPGHEGNGHPTVTDSQPLANSPESAGAITCSGQAGTGKEDAAHKKLFKWNSPIEQEFIYSPPSSQSPQSWKSESPSSTVFRASPFKSKGNRERQLQET